MFYTVKVEKKRYDDFFDRIGGTYHWEVECYEDSNENSRQNYNLRGTGFAHSAEGAKKKALKHLLGVQKDVDAGLKFGVVFTTQGTAAEIKKQLESVDYATE